MASGRGRPWVAQMGTGVVAGIALVGMAVVGLVAVLALRWRNRGEAAQAAVLVGLVGRQVSVGMTFALAATTVLTFQACGVVEGVADRRGSQRLRLHRLRLTSDPPGSHAALANGYQQYLAREGIPITDIRWVRSSDGETRWEPDPASR